MKTKKIIFASLMTISLAVGVTCLLANNKKGLLGTVKADTEYQFVLDGDNAPASYGENISVVSTKKGNALKFNYVGASASTNNHMALTAGGYIQNVEELLDLTTLTVVGTGSFKLHTGFEGYSHIEDFEISSSSKTINLSNTAYFKLEAVTASVVTSITGDFTCTEISYPALTKCASGWDQTQYWNILCRNIDPTQEFDFEFSIREIYTGTDRVQRPRFCIFNADNLYDENYQIKTTNNKCANPFYVIRQDSYQTTIIAGATTEKAIGNADSWLSASTGSKKAENYVDNSTFNNATKDATVTFTMSLRNVDAGQKFTCVQFVDTNVDGIKDITITYTVTRTTGIIFDAGSIGMAIIVGAWASLTTYDLVSTSSSGVR